MRIQSTMKTVALTSFFGMAATAAASAGVFTVSGAGGPIVDNVGGTYPGVFPTGPSVFTVTVPNQVKTVTSVKLQGLTHTWIGDLQAVLRDPAGNGHNLFVRPGYLNTGNFGNSGDFLGGDYTFVDCGTAGALTLPTSSAVATNPPAGSYLQAFGVGAGAWPSGTSAVDNNCIGTIKGAAGVWTLTMYDWGGGDTGAITGWMLSGTDLGPGDIATYCYGDGTGNGGPNCPCGNNSAVGSGEGCVNSTSVGAKLAASGSTSVVANNLVLTASQGPFRITCIFIQGDAQAGPTGLGTTPFNDGLLCVATNILRIGFDMTTGTGTASTGNAAANALAGTSKFYQAVYRNVAGPCSFRANSTNGVAVSWTP